ncbi:MAG: phage holin family protein [Lachnospiraceae bacterium]|nr:phage holin family protein [Lachnospiraceae bacterium]
MHTLKDYICTILGIIGTAIATWFGGWTTAMGTLLLFMAIDFVTGLIVAGVFKKSAKTKTGALESKQSWKGLCRKGMTLLFVLIGHRMDIALGVSYIKNAVCIGFIANELISIAENAGLMGVPLPNILKKAIEVLKEESENTEEN